MKKITILLSLVLCASMAMAQQTEAFKKDSIREREEFLELSRKYPNRRTFYPEDFGEQLTETPKEELLRRLATSKDSIELRKIAQVLGDREMAGTLKLTDAETTIVDTRIRAYIYEKADFYGQHPEVHDQILRFWHLAIPELLRNLENRNEDIQSFVFNILVQMRSERVVRIMINKAKACKPSNLKDMYIGTLGIMTQQEDMNLPNRQCLNEKDSQELFSKIIEPALKELSPETVKAVKD